MRMDALVVSLHAATGSAFKRTCSALKPPSLISPPDISFARCRLSVVIVQTGLAIVFLRSCDIHQLCISESFGFRSEKCPWGGRMAITYSSFRIPCQEDVT